MIKVILFPYVKCHIQAETELSVIQGILDLRGKPCSVYVSNVMYFNRHLKF